MEYTIMLTNEENQTLQAALPTKYITNGVVLTAQEVLTTIIHNEIAQIAQESERIQVAEQVKAKWDTMTEDEKTNIKNMVIDLSEKEMI